MKPCRIAVCEAHPTLRPDTPEWRQLTAEMERTRPEILVLNELPFGPWIAAQDEFARPVWEASVAAHAEGVGVLHELGVPVVLGSRAVSLNGRRCNEAFVWTGTSGAEGVHTKQHIPNAPGYRETTWFESGEPHFHVVQAGCLRVGFLVCTEVMFPEHARQYGRDGADLIVVPRAMPPVAAHFFDVALQMAAIVSGCYVASSNRGGTDEAGEEFEGRGCIIDPLGQTVAQTSHDAPVAFYEVDPSFATWKKSIYPCDVA
jgi:N-carbamoylputrescine amidase